ncbi:hypothetical protein PsorP6_005384 [Peronosclerospora sorghi]|uniref:Uncharacterized protein n=1 Tax=Peronosclerospora sorghi TaxID=230839 RepID=A0ACC0W542_9STRA|nr:hypothetical protein PsorP6_005384 [Peronosclerospora sorghi]
MHYQYLQILKQYGLLADDESVSLFFKFGTELHVDPCLKSSFAVSDPAALKACAKVSLNYAVLYAFTHLMALLVNFLDSSPTAKLQVLNHAVGAIANVLVSAHDLSRKKKAPFDQRVFFRMFVNLMKALTIKASRSARLKDTLKNALLKYTSLKVEYNPTTSDYSKQLAPQVKATRSSRSTSKLRNS